MCSFILLLDDFSRVKLTELPDSPDSDYINACYIDVRKRGLSLLLFIIIIIVCARWETKPRGQTNRQTLRGKLLLLFLFLLILFYRVTVGRIATLLHKVRGN